MLLVAFLAIWATPAGAIVVSNGFASPALVSPAPTAPVASGTWTPLSGITIPSGVVLGAPLAPSANVAGSISFTGTNPSGSNALAQEVNDPSSPYYHHYVNPQEFDQMFAPSTVQQASLHSYLSSHGLTVTVVSPFLWNVRGPASGMDSAFHTTFVHAAAADGNHGWAPLTTMELPASIASGVTVTGAFQNAEPAEKSLNLITKLGDRLTQRRPAPAEPANPRATITVNVTNKWDAYNWDTEAGPVLPQIIFAPTDMNVTYTLNLTGGAAPYSIDWNWGDGSQVNVTSSSAKDIVFFHNFEFPGAADYCFSNFSVACDNITVTVTDKASDTGSLVIPVVPVSDPWENELYYNAVTLYRLGDTGQGSSIGLDEECDPDYPTADYLTDLNFFSAAFGLPQLANGTTLQLIGSGDTDNGCANNGGGSAGWAGETLLDMEYSHSIAPNATLVVDLSASAIQEGDATWVNTTGVYVDSNSWGCPWSASTGCGYSWVTWNQAAAQGQSFLVASGDCGAAGMDGSDNPGDSPAAVSVGGTDIYPFPSGVFRLETSWNGTVDPNGCANDQGSTGGYASNWGDSNTSAVWAPPYQNGTPGFENPYRGLPDLGAIGGSWVDQYQAIYGGWFSDAGTSLASPSWAGMLDLMYDYNKTATKANGFANYDLYNIAKGSDYNTAFHNINVGNNWVNGTGGNAGPCARCYNASQGWNPVDGLGSANLGMLGEILARQNGNPNAIAPLTAVLASNVSFGPASLAVAFGADVAGGPSNLSGYSYSWTFGDGCGAVVSSSYFVNHTYSSPGTYTASVTVSSGSFSGTSNSIRIKVTGTGSALPSVCSVKVSPGTAIVKSGNTQDFTAATTCSSTCPAGVVTKWFLGNSSYGTLNATVGTAVQFTAGAIAGDVYLYAEAISNGYPTVSNFVGIAVTGGVSLATVAISTPPASIGPGKSLDLNATVTCMGGAGSSCPAGVTYAWTLGNPSLGTLNTSLGPAVAFKAGTTTGTESVFLNATFSTTTLAATPVSFSITSIAVSTASISPSSASISSGGAQVFTGAATCSGGTGSTCPDGTSYAWSSSSTYFALNTTSGSSVKVTAGGVAGSGTLELTVSYAGTSKSSNASITVTTALLVSVTQSPVGQSINTGASQTYTGAATCSGGTGSACPAGVVFTWALSGSLATLNATSGTVVKVTAGSSTGTVNLYLNASLDGVLVKSSPNQVSITSASSNGSGSSGWLLYVIIAVVVIAAIVAVLALTMRKKKSSAAPPSAAPWQAGPYQQAPGAPPPSWQAPPPQGAPPAEGGWYPPPPPQ